MRSVAATLRAVGLRPVTPNGVWATSGADAARGARYLDALVRQIMDELEGGGPA
jgi:hypothetical protein